MPEGMLGRADERQPGLNRLFRVGLICEDESEVGFLAPKANSRSIQPRTTGLMPRSERPSQPQRTG